MVTTTIHECDLCGVEIDRRPVEIEGHYITWTSSNSNYTFRAMMDLCKPCGKAFDKFKQSRRSNS